MSRNHEELYKLSKGQVIDLNFIEPDLWRTLARHYNEEAKDQGLPMVRGGSKSDKNEISHFSCTIAGFYDTSHGKFSEEKYNSRDQIIIEVQSYLDMLSPGMPKILS